jgi:hypothetical protein
VVVNKNTRCRTYSSKKSNFHVIEAELNQELNKMRDNGININGELIIAHARSIAVRNQITNFNGSRGWLYNFLNRKFFRWLL